MLEHSIISSEKNSNLAEMLSVAELRIFYKLQQTEKLILYDRRNRFMIKDNSTPMLAKDYDLGINKTVPFYNEFYDQTLDVITQCGFSNIE